MNIRRQFLTILWFASYFVRMCSTLYPQRIQYVAGGQPADIRDFPYQLSLEAETYDILEHICGATVISEIWALTAAHCVQDFPSVRFRLRATTSFKNTGGQVYEIDMITIHQDFNSETMDYDIAAIRVSKPFKYSDMLQPIELATTTPPAGTSVVVSGWGCINFNGSQSDHLHELRLRVLDHNVCQATYKEVTPRMLCAGMPESGSNACYGDHGGPLVTEDNQLVGIVSLPFNIPVVYTDVTKQRDWIIYATVYQRLRSGF